MYCNVKDRSMQTDRWQRWPLCLNVSHLLKLRLRDAVESCCLGFLCFGLSREVLHTTRASSHLPHPPPMSGSGERWVRGHLLSRSASDRAADWRTALSRWRTRHTWRWVTTTVAGLLDEVGRWRMTYKQSRRMQSQRDKNRQAERKTDSYIEE